MDLTLVSGIIGGLGLGTLLNTIITNFIHRSEKRTERLYEEKRNAYLGLLDALHKAAVQPSDAASKEFALWQTRCNVFGSKNVSMYTQRIVDTSPCSVERNEAFDGLLDAIRADLIK